MANIDHAAPKVKVGTAKGQAKKSAGTVNLALTHLPLDFPIKWHLMPGFRHTLIGVGDLCDADCAVTFTHEAVIVRKNHGTAVITGWCEATGLRIWLIDLQPGESKLPSMPNDSKQSKLAAYIAYDAG